MIAICRGSSSPSGQFDPPVLRRFQWTLAAHLSLWQRGRGKKMSMVERIRPECNASSQRASDAATIRRSSSAEYRVPLNARSSPRKSSRHALRASPRRNQGDTPCKAFFVVSHSKQTKLTHARCHTFSRSLGLAPLAPSLRKNLGTGITALPTGMPNARAARQMKWDTVPLNFASKLLKTNESHPKQVGHFFDFGIGG